MYPFTRLYRYTLTELLLEMEMRFRRRERRKENIKGKREMNIVKKRRKKFDEVAEDFGLTLPTE